MVESTLSVQVGGRIPLLGHFDVPVILKDVRPFGTSNQLLGLRIGMSK